MLIYNKQEHKEVLMTKVSIIMPVYNVEEFIKEALDSVTHQTLSEIEIICVIDGSKDNSLKIIEEYAAKDSRIKILEQENQGQGIARNNGIKLAQGEYIGFVDPDDYIELNMFEELYNNAKKFDADVVESNYKLAKNNKIKSYRYATKLPQDRTFQAVEFPEYIFQDPMVPWNKLYKTSFIKNNNINFDIGCLAEDHIFCFKSRLLASKITFCNKSLYYYRIRINSCVNQNNPDRRLKTTLVKNTKDFIENNCFSDAVNNAFNEYIVFNLASAYRHIANQEKESYDNECKMLLNETQYEQYLIAREPKINKLEKIFSVKNKIFTGSKKKVLTLFGKEFILKTYF